MTIVVEYSWSTVCACCYRLFVNFIWWGNPQGFWHPKRSSAWAFLVFFFCFKFIQIVIIKNPFFNQVIPVFLMFQIFKNRETVYSKPELHCSALLSFPICGGSLPIGFSSRVFPYPRNHPADHPAMLEMKREDPFDKPKSPPFLPFGKHWINSKNRVCWFFKNFPIFVTQTSCIINNDV